MVKSALKWLVIATVIGGFSASGLAQQFDAGNAEFQFSCAPCHGKDGKGIGPVSAALKTPPPDLTVLAKKNNGLFPVTAVYEMIDGRRSVGAHGPREMPIWGDRFKRPFIYFPPASPEAVVHARILSLVDYLNRIQEK